MTRAPHLNILLLAAALAGPVSAMQSATDENTSLDWPGVGGSFKEQFFSPSAAINRNNVSELSLAWTHDLDSRRGQEMTPLIIDGVIYVAYDWNRVVALEATTGNLIWQFDPRVDPVKVAQACCDAVTRGIAIDGDSLLMATLDGRLIRLDRHTGEPQWQVATIPENSSYTITGAPRIGAGLVFIGNGGAEMGARGYVSAYRLDSGELAWRFFTLPGNPALPVEHKALELALPTWTGRWWELGGGGTAWDAIVYDEELDQLYIGVGNGGPHNPAVRSPGGGDNLFLSSIVALDPATGDYLWHYQQTPGDAWDFTATQPIILADLTIRGRERKVLMQAPKNGFFYVLDRTDGTLLSAEAFATVNWASGIGSDGRPIVEPMARYYESEEPVLLMPGPAGAHSWQPMAYHPQEQTVFIPVSDVPFVFNARGAPGEVEAGDKAAGRRSGKADRLLREAEERLRGYLLAWDPVEQREKWRFQMPSPVNGGALANAGGLVFAGGGNGAFYAFNSETGQPLWVDQTFGGIIAAPAIYQAGGETYLTVVQGWGGGFSLLAGNLAQLSGEKRNISRVLTYKLGGTALLAPPPPRVQLDSDALTVPAGDLRQGEALYGRHCRRCHGGQVISGGTLPDLRHSPIPRSEPAFRSVLDGVLESRGMPAFSAALGDDELAALRAYILHAAKHTMPAQVPTTVLDNMLTVTNPLSTTIWALAGRLYNDDGALDSSRLSDADWSTLGASAAFIRRSLDRLLQGDRIDVRLPGARLQSEFANGGATAQRVGELISADADAFRTRLRALQDTLLALEQAARAQDAAAVDEKSARLLQACSACHAEYWTR